VSAKEVRVSPKIATSIEISSVLTSNSQSLFAAHNAPQQCMLGIKLSGIVKPHVPSDNSRTPPADLAHIHKSMPEI
jgi:hypothetical protein